MADFFDTTVVIPAFNEAQRIPATLQLLAEQIKARALGPVRVLEVLVVDDGSTDATIEVARKFTGELPGFSVIESGRNYGKGHAVRTGLQRARQPWVLVADADMSTPWPEAALLAKACADSQARISIGSRDIEGSRIKVHQSLVRENLGKSFNLFVRALTGLPFRDTQCGFKLFERESVSAFLSLLEVDRFAWDVELLMYARRAGIEVVEVPVVWEHKENSRVQVFRDGMGMLGSVIRTRLKLRFSKSAQRASRTLVH